MSLFLKQFSRRRFFKYLGMTGIGSTLFGLRADHAQSRTLAKSDSSDPLKVPTRTFGRTGVKLPILSLGCIFDTRQNHVMMHQAVKWGVTYWDTATRYNRMFSEPGIGKYFARFPEHRKRIFLVTKSPTINVNLLDNELDASLKRLQTDYVDLYFIHQVQDVRRELKDDTRRWAEKAKKQGKIKMFGFSVHTDMAYNLKLAAKMDWIDGIMTTYNYRLMVDDEMNRALDACHKAGIGLTAMKTQAGSVRHEMGKENDAALKLTQRFMDKGFTVHQARLLAVWSDPRITAICSQMENMSFLKENVTAAAKHQKLAQADLDHLRQYDSATASSYCAGCAQFCEARLNEAVPVCRIMRYLMYANSYNDLARASRKFRRIPQQIRRTMATLDYTAAEAKCPRNMPIGRLMRKAVRELS